MNPAKGFKRLMVPAEKIYMPRMKKILTALCLLILLGGIGSAVKNSAAQPLGQAHKPIFSQPSEHKHSNENAEQGKFYCPMHKQRSLIPCPHKHSQKDMAGPKQFKIGSDCGGSPVKSLPRNFGFNSNPALMTDMPQLNFLDIAQAVISSPMAYDDPPKGSKKHPPKSL